MKIKFQLFIVIMLLLLTIHTFGQQQIKEQPDSLQDKDTLVSTIPITGRQVIIKSNFLPVSGEANIEINNNFLLYKNNKESIRLINLSTCKVVSRLGKFLGELNAVYFSPSILSSRVPYPLFYIEDGGLIDEVTPAGKAVATKSRIYSVDYEVEQHQANCSWDNYARFNSRCWLFVGSSKKGKERSLFKTYRNINGIQTSELVDVSIDSTVNSWLQNLGWMALKPGGNIVAYAYNYYHAIKFIDLSTMKSFLVATNLKNDLKKVAIKALEKFDGTPIVYYTKCYAGIKYLYCLYQGLSYNNIEAKGYRTPSYLEQYDWNGKLVHRYKLDKCCYKFCVNEETGKAYFVVWRNKAGASPIYEYDIDID
jgi:hypothetical protein